MEPKSQGQIRTEIRHQLQEVLHLFKKAHDRKDLEKIPEFKRHRVEIERVTQGVEFDFSHGQPRLLQKALRIVQWNIERGKELTAIQDRLKNHPYLHFADVLILTETDIGMARSGNRHVAQEIARDLGFQYVYVNNYLFISKGSLRDHDAPEENTLGLHGVTLFSRLPILQFKVLDFPSWLDKIRGHEKCFGVRRGIVALLDCGDGQQLAVAGIHLEAHSSPNQRQRQMLAVLRGVQEFVPSGVPVVLGGDLNTTTYSTFDRYGFVPNLLRHLSRGVKKSVEFDYLYPDAAYEKLFQETQKFGYDYQNWNQMGQGTLVFFPFDPQEREKVVDRLPKFLVRYLDKKLQPYRNGILMKLDWFMGRDLHVLGDGEQHEGEFVSSKPRVVLDVQDEKMRISDHFPIGVDVTWS